MIKFGKWNINDFKTANYREPYWDLGGAMLSSVSGKSYISYVDISVGTKNYLYYSLDGLNWIKFPERTNIEIPSKMWLWNRYSKLSTYFNTRTSFFITGNVEIDGDLSSLINFSEVSSYSYGYSFGGPSGSGGNTPGLKKVKNFNISLPKNSTFMTAAGHSFEAMFYNSGIQEINMNITGKPTWLNEYYQPSGDRRIYHYDHLGDGMFTGSAIRKIIINSDIPIIGNEYGYYDSRGNYKIDYPYIIDLKNLPNSGILYYNTPDNDELLRYMLKSTWQMQRINN